MTGVGSASCELLGTGLGVLLKSCLAIEGPENRKAFSVEWNHPCAVAGPSRGGGLNVW